MKIHSPKNVFIDEKYEIYLNREMKLDFERRLRFHKEVEFLIRHKKPISKTYIAHYADLPYQFVEDNIEGMVKYISESFAKSGPDIIEVDLKIVN